MMAQTGPLLRETVQAFHTGEEGSDSIPSCFCSRGRKSSRGRAESRNHELDSKRLFSQDTIGSQSAYLAPSLDRNGSFQRWDLCDRWVDWAMPAR